MTPPPAASDVVLRAVPALVAPAAKLHGSRGRGIENTVSNFRVPAGATLADLAAAALDRPGVHRILVDADPAFAAFVLAFDHPFAAVTSAEGPGRGAYEWKDVPAGRHVVVCWHERLDPRPRIEGARVVGYDPDPDVVIERTVDVEAGRTSVVDDTIGPPK
jgi:hypothetical protein